MKIMKLAGAVAIFSLFLTACNDKAEKLKVGVISGPEHKVMEVAAKNCKGKI